MQHVYNESQLQEALKSGERTIVLHGDIADKVERKYKAKKRAKIGGAVLIVGGLLAAPISGGLSLPAAIAGATVTGLTVSTAELAILVGGAVALAGINNGYDVRFNGDGTVIMTRK